MDNSGLGGGFLPGPIIDLESSIPRLSHQSHINILGDIGDDNHPISVMEVRSSNTKGFVMNFGQGKSGSHVTVISDGNMSDEDEPNFVEEENCENSNEGKGKRGSYWHRMKWTDNMVRLLIAVVACVGDDGMLESGEGHKRKSGNLQKKGKWKTVSKLMIGKGCQVSPQQCEDKFNDLNKRFKRLNDILGRRFSCQVVENPAIMDSIPDLSAKAKDDVRKILGSKHLFYKEMCAYHNGLRIPNCNDIDLQGCSERCSKDNNGSEEEEADRNHDSDDDESDNEDNHNDDEDGERIVELGERKKRSVEDGRFCTQSSGMDSFEAEMAEIFHDPSKSSLERKEWIKKQKLQLQDQRFGFQVQAFELEKQRLKWLRYCSKKDKELERLRLENESLRLDNERMILHVKQKELEIDFRSEASLDPTALANRQQGREHIDLTRHQ
ncbi:hypothetical protein Patl1_29722 [Pistacia atlantica]|uniref:Uncharacterized protein n=1 Tax=Pistacia atlantica TaxID=434234 RepID=A0ACC1ACF7_9ROSI|nr:hypothetical protein Patl1_29722 [Pistacia atlantica]